MKSDSLEKKDLASQRAKLRLPEDIGNRIVYEDNHLLVFNKACGEISQADKTGDQALGDTLKAFIKIRDKKPGNVFLQPVHRLDRPTSGILIFAKTSKALSRLAAIFRERELEKIYLAIVSGSVAEAAAAETSTTPNAQEAFAWHNLLHHLSRNEKQNKSYASLVPSQNSQEARLAWRLLRTGDRYHLLEIRLETGRHHQIRAQLATLGLHIKGDLKYGAERSNRDGGICLHAYRLTLPHPVREEVLNLEALPHAVQAESIWKSLLPVDSVRAKISL